MSRKPSKILGERRRVVIVTAWRYYRGRDGLELCDVVTCESKHAPYERLIELDGFTFTQAACSRHARGNFVKAK